MVEMVPEPVAARSGDVEADLRVYQSMPWQELAGAAGSGPR